MKRNENKELEALISLLDDPDDVIFGQVKTKIIDYGPQAIPTLENAWENAFDNTIHDRIENLIHKIQINKLFKDFKSWKSSDENNLLDVFLLLTRFQYPDVNTDKLSKEVALLIRDVWLELNNNLTALEKIKVLNHIFFEIHKYSGNKKNFYSPDNFFLNKILETKHGNPISLGLLYIIIAQSLKIPIYGVDLPKHFILMYADEISEGGLVVSNDEALFYINPFNNGAVFTRNEIDLYIKQLGISKKGKFYKAGGNLMVIKRMLTELIFSYDKAGSMDKAEELRELYSLLFSVGD
jgi:regulator of sirC expression with transglutaminase-like and TPR domain